MSTRVLKRTGAAGNAAADAASATAAPHAPRIFSAAHAQISFWAAAAVGSIAARTVARTHCRLQEGKGMSSFAPPKLVPPFRFATVEVGVYRGAYPSLKVNRCVVDGCCYTGTREVVHRMDA